MKIIKPSVELLKPTDPILHIEQIARVCYKSEDAIKPGTAEKLITMLIKNGHEAMLESYVFVAEVSKKVYKDVVSLNPTLLKFLNFTDFTFNGSPRYLISGNARAWRNLIFHAPDSKGVNFVVQRLIDLYPIFNAGYKVVTPPGYDTFISSSVQSYIDLSDNYNGFDRMLHKLSVRFLTEPEIDNLYSYEKKYHHYFSFKFICDRGVLAEITRHRQASFAAESTRYVNYSKDKFGSEITVVEPCYYKPGSYQYKKWLNMCRQSERYYMDLLANESKPQEARSILLNSLKTEVVMTANGISLDNFFDLRTAPTAHPSMQEVAKPAFELYCQRPSLMV
jgi:thymidylate synthase (FAD)